MRATTGKYPAPILEGSRHGAGDTIAISAAYVPGHGVYPPLRTVRPAPPSPRGGLTPLAGASGVRIRRAFQARRMRLR